MTGLAVVLLIVPHVVEQAAPFCVRAQVTPALAGSLLTVAVNGWVVPPGSNALMGATETVIASTVTVAEAEAELSATEVAATLRVRLLGGGVAGAV